MSSLPPEIYVINARGEKELFSSEKVYQSARRAGASSQVAQDIAAVIQAEVFPGIRTFEIFNKIKKLLTGKSPTAALRFSIKEAIRKLGPTGYPFEKYIQQVLARNNFKTEESQILTGKCANHEIDFLAYRQSKATTSFPHNGSQILFVGECKYHLAPGSRVDLEVALSLYARFLDLKEGPYLQKPKFRGLTPKPMLATNTKFTNQVIEYAKCIGIDLIGWRYPIPKGLEFLVENERLYPITILPSLKENLLELFFEKKIVLVEDILRIDSKKLAQELDLSEDLISRLKEEAKLLS